MPTVLRMTFQAIGNVPPFTIEVFTVSFDAVQALGLTSTSQASGAGAGRVIFDPFSFTKRPDVHSADFWSRACAATVFQSVTLSVSAAGAPAPYCTFTMGTVACKKVSFAASETDGAPLETILLEYGQCAYSVAPQNADGTLGKPVVTAWDGIKNTQIEPGKVGSV